MVLLFILLTSKTEYRIDKNAVSDSDEHHWTDASRSCGFDPSNVSTIFNDDYASLKVQIDTQVRTCIVKYIYIYKIMCIMIIMFQQNILFMRCATCRCYLDEYWYDRLSKRCYLDAYWSDRLSRRCYLDAYWSDRLSRRCYLDAYWSDRLSMREKDCFYVECSDASCASTSCLK